MTTRHTRLVFGLLPWLLVIAAGCGPQKSSVKVKGVVTVDGKPVPIGSVVFQNEANTEVGTGLIGPNGEYTAEGVPLGEVKVAVKPKEVPASDTFKPLRPPVGMPKDVSGPKDAKPPNPNELPPDVVDRIKAAAELLDGVAPEFKDPAKSPYKATLQKGENTVNVELKSVGKVPKR